MSQFVTQKAELPLPQPVMRIANAFHKEGFQLFAVGGAVRDFLFWLQGDQNLPFQPKDIDLTTDALPWEVTALLNRNNIRCFGKGESFGVISAVIDGVEYEIATFREEWYDPEHGDGRRPDKHAYSTVDKDAARRDLTINALFFDIANGEVRDYNVVNGQGQGFLDIANRVARPVGIARDRFREDKLRIMRLVRFFSRFNSGVIARCLDQDVLEAVREFRLMEGVSSERIVAEFESGLAKCQSPVNYLRSLESLGLQEAVFHNHADFSEGEIERVGQCRNVTAVLAWLLRDCSNAKQLLNELKYANEVSLGVDFLHKLHRFDDNQIIGLLRRRDLWKQEDNVAQREVMEANVRDFAKIAGIEEDMERFLRYEPIIVAEPYMSLPPAQRGKAMSRDEAANYRLTK